MSDSRRKAKKATPSAVIKGFTDWFSTCPYIWFVPEKWFYGFGANCTSEFREIFYSCPVKYMRGSFPTALIEGHVDISHKNFDFVSLSHIPISMKLTTCDNEEDFGAGISYNSARILFLDSQSKPCGFAVAADGGDLRVKLEIELLCGEAFFIKLMEGIEKYHQIGQSRLNVNFIEHEDTAIQRDQLYNCSFLLRSIYSVYLDMLHSGE